MKRSNAIIALFLVCVLAGNISIIIQQQALINQYKQNEIILLGDSTPSGATITMRVFRDGILTSEETHHNLIPDAARSALRGHIADSALTVWNYIAIGTGSGGGASSTTLVNEYSRYLGVYGTVGSFNFTLVFTWTEGNFTAEGQTITEYGVFNDSGAGIMLSYDDSFSRGPLYEEDVLEVTVNYYIAP